MPSTFYLSKDPQETLDYTMDWTKWLAPTETITACTVSQPIGLTVSAPTLATPNVTVRISGGTTGQSYDVIWHATTSTGQQPERTLTLTIVDR